MRSNNPSKKLIGALVKQREKDGLSRNGSLDKDNREYISTINGLSEKLVKLLKNSKSRATEKAIRSDIRKFNTWCANRDLSNLPCSPETLAEWIADLQGKSSVASIARYVSSVSTVHDLEGYDNPARSELVRLAMKGLRRLEAGTPAKKAPALRLDQLMKILDGMSSREWPSRRNKAILAVGWSAALRASEICALNIEDIQKAPEGLIVWLRKSKTDQEGKGIPIGIPASPLADIILDWISAVTRLYGTDSGPLFPRIGYAQVDRWFPSIGPRGRLSTRSLHKLIVRLLRTIGVNGSVHSLRRGMITSAAAAGVSEHLIQRHSRHRSVAVLRGYVDEGNLFTHNPLLPLLPLLDSLPRTISGEDR
jgi:integrase